jgi:hypothetical protein
MKYAFFTYSGEGLAVAYKLLKEGNEVVVGMLNEHPKIPDSTPEYKKRRLKLFDGLLEKHDAQELVNKLKKENPKDWFVFCDFNYLYPIAEQLKKRGFRGLLPSQEDFDLENDRESGKDFVFSHYKVFSIQEVHEFQTIEEAKQFLSEQEKVYGIKGYNPDAPTFFPASNNPKIALIELTDIMDSYKKEYESEGFILEEKIENLIEITPEIVVYDGEPLGMNIDLELKPVGNGNLGYLTGDAASFIMWIEKDSPAWKKLYELFFQPALSKIIRPNELVIWDAGVMYSPSRNKFYFSEYAPSRPGYNAFFNELSTFDKVSTYFEKIINKEPLFDKKTKPFGCSIRVFNLLPDKKFKEMYQDNILVYGNPDDKNLWFFDIYKRGNNLYTVGMEKDVAVVTASGDNWEEGFKEIDEKLSSGEYLVFPSMYYRKSFDILDNSYNNNLGDRYEFVCKFLELNTPKISSVNEEEEDETTLLNKILSHL